MGQRESCREQEGTLRRFAKTGTVLAAAQQGFG